MSYEIKTLTKGTKLYKMCHEPAIDMDKVKKHQSQNPPADDKKHWAYSLYFSQDVNVCAGYAEDYETPYLIEITLSEPIYCIFTEDPIFFKAGISREEFEKHMHSTVVPKIEKVIGTLYNEVFSELHYPEAPFMKTLGEKGFAFSDRMNEEGEREIIIPQSLLTTGSFTQRKLKYKLNNKGNAFDWIEE